MCRNAFSSIKARVKACFQRLSDRVWWFCVILLSFAVGWVLWFLQALYFEGSHVFDEMKDRGRDAVDQSSKLFIKLYDVFWTLCDVVVAWSLFLTPFVADTVVALRFLWQKIPETSIEFKCIVAGIAVFIFLLWKIIQAARRNISTLKFWLFQLVYLACSPVLFYGLMALPVEFLPMLAYLITQVIPTSKSLKHVYSIYVDPRKEITLLKESEILIGYWVCWPFIDCVNYLPSTFEKERQIITIVVVILCVWLLFCGGSRLFYQFATSLFNLIKPLLSKIMQCLPLPSCKNLSFSQIMKLQNAFNFAMTYKKITIPILIVVFFFCFRAYMLIMDMISWFVWRACVIDSARVLSLKIRDLYIDKISFWIICQTVLAIQQTSIWVFIGWTQPFILMGSMIMGRTIMDFLIRVFPLSQVQQGMKVARESLFKAAISPRSEKTEPARISAKSPSGTLENASEEAKVPDDKEKAE